MSLETFFGLLVLGCIGAYFTWHNGFKTRQATAAVAFRDTLSITVTHLSGELDPTASIVRNSHQRHIAAIAEFRRYVPRVKRKNFERDAAAYYQQAEPYQALGIFATLAAEPAGHEKRMQLVAAIQRLLSYAQQP